MHCLFRPSGPKDPAQATKTSEIEAQRVENACFTLTNERKCRAQPEKPILYGLRHEPLNDSHLLSLQDFLSTEP